MELFVITIILTTVVGFVAGWLAMDIAKTLSTKKSAPSEEEAPKLTKLERALQWAATCWPYPEGQIAQAVRTGELSDVQQECVPVGTFGGSMSPAHRLMTATHPNTAPEFREELWQHPEFRFAVAWVFQNTQEVEALEASTVLIRSGYWYPMGRLLLEAVNQGLISALPKHRDTADQRAAVSELKFKPLLKLN
jgi:hypothetical protein